MAVADYLMHLQASLPGQDLAWLRQLRAAALAQFSAGGFPTSREEDWKYTQVAALERRLFAPTHQATAAPPAAIAVDASALPVLNDAYRLVFEAGYLRADLSRLPTQPGVFLTSLADLLNTEPERAKNLLGVTLANHTHGFIQFNSAGFSDGVVLQVSAGCRLDKPLHLLFIAGGQQPAVLRNLILLEAGAEAEVVESYIGAGDSAYLTVALNEITLHESAKLTLTRLQCESSNAYHFGATFVRQGKAALFEHHNFAFGALLARSEIYTDLAEAGDCRLNGLFLAQDQQLLDNFLRVEHREPSAVSRETYKGILTGRARGVFQGRVVVHEHAQHSDAAMNNRNLLLSEHAEIDTKPQLEIYADDVKCAHGVTIGQLDAASVFFLKSRGLDETEARGLLTFAFANEMVDKIAGPELRRLVQRQLPAHFSIGYDVGNLEQDYGR